MPTNTNNISHLAVIKYVIRTTANKIASGIVFAVKDVILAWPRALFVALPLAARNMRILSEAKTLFMPEVRNISMLAHGFFSRTTASIEVLNKLNRALAKLADHVGPTTAEATCGRLEEQRLKLQRLKAFVTEVMAPQEGEEAASDEPEMLQEVTKATVLLNRLIKDLSSRTGFFTKGKKPDEPVEHTLARATAISVKEPARSPDELLAAIDPYSAPGPVATAVAIPVRMAPALTALETSAPTIPSRVAVVLRPAPVSAPLNTRSDAQFLQKARNLGQSQPNTVLNYFVSVVHFIAVNILIGIPKFILYDLPQAIISFESWSSYYVSKIESSSQTLIEIKNLLIAMNGIFLQLDRLTPAINGVELYLSRHLDQDALAAADAFKELMAQIDSALETLEPGQIRTIKSEVKKLILRVNPMLVGAITALEGKSIWGAVTTKKSASPAGASASDAGSVISGASSAESSTNTFAGLLKAALNAIAVPPPGGGSPPEVRPLDASSLGGSSLSSGSGELKDPAAASVAGSSTTGTPVAAAAKKPNAVAGALSAAFGGMFGRKPATATASETPKASAGED